MECCWKLAAFAGHSPYCGGSLRRSVVRDGAARRALGEASRLALPITRHVAAYRLYRALPPDARRAPAHRPRLLPEIKHDGFRLMARRDVAGVRLFPGSSACSDR
jgi:hypothetical protein